MVIWRFGKKSAAFRKEISPSLIEYKKAPRIFERDVFWYGVLGITIG